MKLLGKIYVLLILALMISSCHKDQDDENIINKTNPSPVIFEEIKGNVFGNVKDINNQPIVNATVTIYSSVAQTDEHGVFNFKDVKLDKQGTYIRVEKSGYITASDVVYPKAGNTSYSHITMLILDISNTFNSNEGGDISSNGVKVSFAPNSIVKPDGTDYKGKVYVSSKVLKAGDKNLGDVMPGTLRGENKKGSTVVLGTAGMILVELMDNTGAELNIKQGKTAKMEFVVEESDVAHLPNEIPLWYFDEDKGFWVEEGKAKLQDGKYIGELPHFSWWNLDVEFEPVNMCSTVKYENGKPAENLIIQLEADIVFPVAYGFTDNEGKACGLVPKDKEMVLSVIDPFCNEVLYTSTVGPFGEDVVLDDIILPYDAKFGQCKVVCNGVPEPNAVVIIRNSWGNISIPVDENGVFDLNQFIGKCDSTGSEEFNIFAYNPVTNQASGNVTLNAEGNGGEDIVLNLCADCDFEVDIETEYGTECDPSSIKSLTAKVSGSGTYEYLWSNGATEASITDLEDGLNCVTVTETNTDCEVVKCMEVNLNGSGLFLKPYAFNTFCGQDNGLIFVFPIGGTPPYEVSVTGPDGFTADTFLLQGLAAGVYVFTVKDNVGCTATQEVELQDIEPEVYLEQYPDFEDSNAVFVFAHVNVRDSIDLPINLEDSLNSSISYLWSTGETESVIKVEESGTYCVTVTASQDCEFTDCIDVEVDAGGGGDNGNNGDPIVVGCQANMQYVYTPKSSEIITETGMIYEVDSVFEMNVLIDGYSFQISYPGYPLTTFYVPSISTQGGSIIVVDEVVNTSCTSCNDGKINYHFDDNQAEYLLDSEFGHIGIYAEDDLGTDLSETNDNGELNSGTYYIVVHDKNTDCYIAHEKVIVE